MLGIVFSRQIEIVDGNQKTVVHNFEAFQNTAVSLDGINQRVVYLRFLYIPSAS
jgi:hypothetical protein